MVKWILVGILALPLAEIVVFVLVGAAIGFLLAIALTLATSFIGAIVLRRAGREQIAGFRVAVSDGSISGIEAQTANVPVVLGGFLLLLPGFITDVFGALLLIGPVRRWLSATFGRVMRQRQQAAEGVVELDPDEWRQVPDRELENRRNHDHDRDRGA